MSNMGASVVIFDVKRGLSVFVVSPNKYGILIDCGCSDLGSPVDVISSLSLTKWNGNQLTYFIQTHPHSDHLKEIKELHTRLSPAIVHRRQDLDWEKVRKSNRSNE